MPFRRKPVQKLETGYPLRHLFLDLFDLIPAGNRHAEGRGYFRRTTQPYLEQRRSKFRIMNCQIKFPSDWINASALEQVLRRGCEPHGADVYEVLFVFPTGCKIMVDTAVRLLSLFNQLDCCMRRVRLDFADGEAGAMGYLNRMGFFDHLSGNVEVLPARPVVSGVEIYGGTNAKLVEITRINREYRDDRLPSRLTEAVMHSCGDRADAKELKGAAWTIFAELIDNIFSHSHTPLDGYAALQLYSQGNKLQVAVSDSGLGIMDTLCQRHDDFYRFAKLLERLAEGNIAVPA